MTVKSILLSLFILCGAINLPLVAAEESAPTVTLLVDNVQVLISIPEGYSNAIEIKEFSLIGDLLTPRDRRMLAIFIPKEDIESFKKTGEATFQNSHIVSVKYSDEKKYITEQSFSVARQKVRSQYSQMIAKAGEGQTKLDELAQRAATITGKSMGVRTTGVQSIGVIEESDKSITVGLYGTTELRNGQEVIKESGTGAITIAIIRGKPLYLHTRGGLRDDSDIEMTCSRARNWIASIHSLN
jgi:hypothetical protein